MTIKQSVFSVMFGLFLLISGAMFAIHGVIGWGLASVGAILIMLTGVQVAKVRFSLPFTKVEAEK
jgi:hypothetical protein